MVVLNTEVTDELRREGIAKDLIRTIQSQRKEIACEYTDRIEVGIVSDDPEVVSTLDAHRETQVPDGAGDRTAQRLSVGNLGPARHQHTA